MDVDPGELDAKAVAPYTRPPATSRASSISFSASSRATSSTRSRRARSCRCCSSRCSSDLRWSCLGARGKRLAAHRRPDCRRVVPDRGIVMRLAPLGAFGAMAFTVGNFGRHPGDLGKLVLPSTRPAVLFLRRWCGSRSASAASTWSSLSATSRKSWSSSSAPRPRSRRCRG